MSAVVVLACAGLFAISVWRVSSTSAASSRTFVSLVPARLLDTRADGGTADGAFAGGGTRAADSVLQLAVAGRGGVAADASAVVLNVTVTDAWGPGYVTVFPCGSDRPLASSVNFVTGSTVANGVVSRIGASGQVCLYVSAATDLVVDVTGFFPAGAGFTSLVPARLLDSRADGATVDGSFVNIGVRAAGSVTELKVTGRGAVASNATAAVLNVTATDPAGEGYVTVYPCGGPRPLASSLNFSVGATVPNGVITRIGSSGRVCLFVSVATHLVVDVTGYFPPSSGFAALVPARLLDSRHDGSTVDGTIVNLGIRAAGSVTELPVAGRGGVAADAPAVVLNVTVTDADGAGYVTVYPCGSPRPLASSVNFVGGVTVANGVVGRVGAGGKVCLYVSAAAHLVVDVAGYFTASGSGSGPSDSIDIPSTDDIPSLG